MIGRFIVLEGGEGSGKTTQARLLVARLRAAGRPVVGTFEPGATPLGSRIRTLVLDGPASIDPMAEALLMAADRAQHVATVIRPALARGDWVVCDRFAPSSLVYQGIARELGVGTVETISSHAVQGVVADLVVVIDVEADVAATRRRAPTDRLERESETFHERVRAGYRSLAAERGWSIIDGDHPPEMVADAVWSAAEGLGA
ncbi:MAG TPA: dTMP kinase [Acidimicrobiia bacterium]|nr:dTMP kinase [Acidimicrobiia bacterium]